jgi:hypothetical protein
MLYATEVGDATEVVDESILGTTSRSHGRYREAEWDNWSKGTIWLMISPSAFHRKNKKSVWQDNSLVKDR